MSKTISLTYEGKTYTLEYNRKSVEVMERQGFSIDDVGTRPMTTLTALFTGAFRANHPTVKRDVIDNIFALVKGKEGLYERLVEMYSEPLNALLEDPEDGEGNVTWEASW